MFPVPAPPEAPVLPSAAVRAAATRAVRGGATHYTERAGIPALRAELAARLGTDAEQVILTSGPRESLFLALAGLVPSGGTVAASDDSCAELLASLGLGLVTPLRAGAGIAALLLEADHAGGLPADASGLIDAARAAGTLVIVRERPGPGTVSLAATGLADRVVIIGDLARSGLERWGAGYLLGPPALMAAVVDLKQGLNICSSGLAQYATVAAAQQFAGLATPPDRSRGGLRLGSGTAPGASSGAPQAGSGSVSDESTRQRYELLDLLARTPGAITLGRGDPDLPTPAPIVAAAVAAMSRPAVRDPDPLGLPALREAIARKLLRENHVAVDPFDEVLVTTGGQEAIFLLLQVLTRPGDEVLMPGPRYTSYDVGANMAGARIVTVPPPGPLDFRLDPSAVEALIGPRTRALLIITPGNPTACVADGDRLAAVGEIARRHDLMVIADEIYERILYDGVQHVSMASLPGMRERTITVGGFSKSYAMTGWRVGYLAGPAEVVARVSALKQLWSGTTSVISQHAALTALVAASDLAAPAVARYTERRALALAALDRLGLPYAPAQGAFYAFFDIGALGMPAYELSRRLLSEAGVFLYPGSGFGPEWGAYMRMAWLQPRDRLEEALTRMGTWIEAHR
jgi:aminotransferase